MRLEAQSSHKKYPKNGCRELATITPHLGNKADTRDKKRQSSRLSPSPRWTKTQPWPQEASPGLSSTGPRSPSLGPSLPGSLCLRSLSAPPDDPNLVGVRGKDRNRLLGTCLGVGKQKGANPKLSPPPGRGCAAPNLSRITGRKDGRTQGSLQYPAQRPPHLCNPSQDPLLSPEGSGSPKPGGRR